MLLHENDLSIDMMKSIVYGNICSDKLHHIHHGKTKVATHLYLGERSTDENIINYRSRQRKHTRSIAAADEDVLLVLVLLCTWGTWLHVSMTQFIDEWYRPARSILYIYIYIDSISPYHCTLFYCTNVKPGKSSSSHTDLINVLPLIIFVVQIKMSNGPTRKDRKNCSPQDRFAVCLFIYIYKEYCTTDREHDTRYHVHSGCLDKWRKAAISIKVTPPIK